MDNFPSFTELGQLPDWYEGEYAGRAAGPGAAAGCMSKMAENLGVWSLHRSCWDPGHQSQVTESAENRENLTGVLRTGRRAPRARIFGLRQLDALTGVSEFVEFLMLGGFDYLS